MRYWLRWAMRLSILASLRHARRSTSSVRHMLVFIVFVVVVLAALDLAFVLLRASLRAVVNIPRELGTAFEVSMARPGGWQDRILAAVLTLAGIGGAILALRALSRNNPRS